MKISIHYSIFLIFFTLILIQKNYSQRPEMVAGKDYESVGKISGTIVDANSNVTLEYATIGLFKAKDSSVVSGTISNEKGKFIIDKVPYGKHYLIIQFIGYKPFKTEMFAITPKNSEYQAGTIKLYSSSQNLESVEIVSKKEANEFSLDKKIVNVDQNIASMGGTAVDVLQTIPSITVDIDGNVSLMGSKGITILVDGRPSGLVSLDQMPASMIDRIEIVTNPSARYDPEGMSGIINIVLKKQREPGYNGMTSLNVGTGNKLNASVNLNYKVKKINLFANYNLRKFAMGGYSDMNRESILLDTTYNLIQYQDFSRSGMFHNIKAGVDYFINDNNTLSFSALYNTRQSISETDMDNKNTYSNEQVIDFFKRYAKTTNKDNGIDLTLNYKKKFDNKGKELTADAFYTYSLGDDNEEMNKRFYTINLEPDSILPNLENSNTYETNQRLTLQADYVNPFGKIFRLETGIKANMRNNNEDYLFNNFNNDSLLWVKDTTTSNNFIYNQQVYAAYGIFSGALGNLKFQLGLRAEETIIKATQKESNKVYNNNFFDVFPTIHLRYDFTEKHSLQISYSRRINRPNSHALNPFINNSDPLNLSAGNPYLKPEYINSVELGHSINFWKTNVNTTLFFKHIYNIISTEMILNDDGTTFSTSKNLNSGLSYGFEFVVSQEITKWWKVNANYSLFRKQFEGTTTSNIFDKNNFSWTVKANSFTTLWKNLDLQISFVYNAPVITVQGGEGHYSMGGGQGKQNEMYYFDGGAKLAILKGKASINLRVSDIFKTIKYDMITYGENFTSSVIRRRDSRVIYLGFTYKILNYKVQRDKKKIDENQQDEGE